MHCEGTQSTYVLARWFISSYGMFLKLSEYAEVLSVLIYFNLTSKCYFGLFFRLCGGRGFHIRMKLSLFLKWREKLQKKKSLEHFILFWSVQGYLLEDFSSHKQKIWFPINNKDLRYALNFSNIIRHIRLTFSRDAYLSGRWYFIM